MALVELLPEIAFALDILIRVGFSARIIARRGPVGFSLAWLSVALIFPYFGAIIYLAIGELRLGSRPAQWAARIHEPFEAWLKTLRQRSQVDWSGLGDACKPLARLTEKTAGIPAMPGNELQLIGDTDEVLRSIISDVDASKTFCHMEFYIWNEGGLADEVAEALLRAASRNVTCRVLIDTVGSSHFLRSRMVRKLRDGGVKVVSALPGGLIRALFVRFDLRLHRKIVVIDNQVAYTGSLNLVDPRFFKRGAGVGQWIDAMVRVRGPAVEGLAVTFLEDWELETGEGLEQLAKTADVHPIPECGDSVVQVVPSGPLLRNEAIRQILLMAIYSARRELVMTTPYFVPDESLLTALVTAAERGVEVTIVVPAKVDSWLIRLASQAHKGDLITAGIHVAEFDGGLLHTKSITVDGQFCLFGSLNLDPRSLHLNFEITLSVYDEPFTSELRALQQSYIEQSRMMDLKQWESSPRLQRFAENTARLLGPLL